MKRVVAFITICSVASWSLPVSVLYAQVATDTPVADIPSTAVTEVLDTPIVVPVLDLPVIDPASPESVPPPEVIDLPEVVDASTTPTQEGSNPQNASSSPFLQGAEGGQDAIPPTETSATTTISTSTPEVVPEEVIPPVDEVLPQDEVASTTEELPPPEEMVVLPEEPQPQPEEMPPPTEEPLVQQAVVEITMEELAPEPEYVFSVKTGKRMDTKRVTKKTVLVGQKVVTTDIEEVVTALPTIIPDNADGIMNISGACSDTYYTVLLYKNAIDYDRDRRAYVVNKAYPCVGGIFNYELSDLPPTLPSGTYYILIGSQGESGPWVPITGLTEVEITNKQTF